MLFQNSHWEEWLNTLLQDPIYGYMRGINLIEWIIAISIMYIIGFIFMRRSHKYREMETQSALFRAFNLFFWINGITRICFVFAYFIEPYYNMLLAIGYLFGSLSLLPVILTLEKNINQITKHFFSIIGYILVIAGFLFTFLTYVKPIFSEISRTIQDIGMPIMCLSFIILYGYIIKNSTGDIRKKAMMTLIGMIVFVAGILLDSESLLESNPSLMHLAPIVFIIGELIVVNFQKAE